MHVAKILNLRKSEGTAAAYSLDPCAAEAYSSVLDHSSAAWAQADGTPGSVIHASGLVARTAGDRQRRLATRISPPKIGAAATRRTNPLRMVAAHSNVDETLIFLVDLVYGSSTTC